MVKKKKGKKATRFDREQMRKDLKKQTEDSYNRRDDSGRFNNYFKPDTVKLWIPGKGEHRIDIIPYQVGGNDPHADEGSWNYILDLFVHTNIGPTEDQAVCPAYNYKKPCPICEKQKKLRDEGEEDEAKALLPKRRNAYNIIVRDDGQEEKKGVQQLEIAHYFIGRTLFKIAKTKKGMIQFQDPDEGSTLVFERTGTGKENTGYDGHKLEERDYEITDDELEAAVVLDEAIILQSYEELASMLAGKTDDEDEDDEDDDIDDDDDDEDDEDDEPVRKPKKKVKKKLKETECPEDDGEFGVDTDGFDECEDCPIYDDCMDEYDKRKAAKKKGKKKRK